MLWVKAFHIIFVVTWFAGLFYLPRLFVYHATATDQISIDRFRIMERRLFIMTCIGAAGTLVLGFWLTLGWYASAISSFWLLSKLALVLLLVIFHLWLGLHTHWLASHNPERSDRFYRLANEIPSLFLIAIVILVVVKPGVG